MLIRSQNRLSLELISGGVTIEKVYRKNGKYYSCANTIEIGEGALHLYWIRVNQEYMGEYSSKNKAIKVLNMICEFYDKCLAFSMGNDGCYHESSVTKVFQMPHDSEVEE